MFRSFTTTDFRVLAPLAPLAITWSDLKLVARKAADLRPKSLEGRTGGVVRGARFSQPLQKKRVPPRDPPWCAIPYK